MTRWVGLDLSLASTGWAVIDANGFTVGAVRPTDLAGLPRLRWLSDRVLDVVRGASAVAVEGPAYSRQAASGVAQQGHHERAGLWWRVYDLVDLYGVPVVVVTPGSLKLYATGKGNAPKTAVVAAFRSEFPRVDLPPGKAAEDAADAAWLALMVAHHAGRPLVITTPDHVRALHGVRWHDTDAHERTPAL